tara:strand:- start:42 stop:227 length:186 start_codon:yes stop_codon:yes gene_type:complete
MNIKNTLAVAFLMLSTFGIYAQKVNIKKGDIFVDDVKCLTVDGSPINFSYFNLEDEELFIR